MAPAAAFQLGESAAAIFEGRCLVTSVAHRLHNPAFFTNEAARVYDNDFEAIPVETPFRPPAPVWPQIAGHHTAMVRGPGGEEKCRRYQGVGPDFVHGYGMAIYKAELEYLESRRRAFELPGASAA